MAQITDKNRINRFAQPLVVEARPCSQASGYGVWQPVYNARVEEITLNAGADAANTAVITFPTLRWNQMFTGLNLGVNIRIRTDAPVRGDGSPYRGQSRAVLFQGFLTNYRSRFAGGTGQSSPTETNTVICMDYRWLMSRTSPVFGIYARSRDNYDTFETTPVPANSATHFSGRRCIFNADGQPNRDATAYSYSVGGDVVDTPLFSGQVYGDPQPWTARQMLQYLLSPYLNRIYSLFKINDVTALTGVDHADFDRVINHISVDAGNIISGIDLILKNIGQSMREEYTLDGPQWVFYRPGEAVSEPRSTSAPVILHSLHAPAAGEVITDAVADGLKMLYGAEFDEDISAVINTPVGLGAPERYEFTAELVPAWLDSDLSVPDGTEIDPFFSTEAVLQAEANPNRFDIYKYYHASGSSFKRDVGRKWALNEAGDYSASASFDRGMPFDFADVLDAADAYVDGVRKYGLFRRVLLECLTFDASDLNSVGIRVEFSFDGGSTWHVPQTAASVLTTECGIRIEDPNLSELLDPAGGVISGGDLDGQELNYWTSLLADKADGNSFKDNEWNTRVRVTASVQLDQRLLAQSLPTSGSGSPFYHRRVFDFSDRYTYSVRTDSSVFDGGALSAWNTNEYDKLTAHLDALRDANENMSINGRFTLDRLWLGDGSGAEDFRLGDGVEAVTGRNYSMAAAIDGTTVYPEIIQITYDVQRQKQHLITRDLRLANMRT
ncbi:MAG: hypothetical protein WC551_11245 [Patescibacteria group bacterium]